MRKNSQTITLSNLNKQDLTAEQQNLIEQLVIEFLKEGKAISIKVEEKQPDGIILVGKGWAKDPNNQLSFNKEANCYRWHPYVQRDGKRFRCNITFSGVQDAEVARKIRDTILSDEELKMILYNGIKGVKKDRQQKQKLIQVIKLMAEGGCVDLTTVKDLVKFVPKKLPAQQRGLPKGSGSDANVLAKGLVTKLELSELITAKELAKTFDVTYRTIKRWEEKFEWNPVYITKSRTRYRRDQIEDSLGIILDG
jgi:hypothetical protein